MCEMDLDVRVLSDEESIVSRRLLAADVQVRLQRVNQRDTEGWAQVHTREDWERLRDIRIEALRDSLGSPLLTGRTATVEVVKESRGEGFRVQNLVFESRPHLLVTANLYQPEPRQTSMPGVLLCHSHHNPKTQGELQDIGVMWARQGAMVLVMDQIGHGERRQQRFGGRQDYYSRYTLGMQLHLVGESLIGWMVADLMCGVDVLLNQPDVDPDSILLVGSVAGGGDPAAVAAALDPRISCVIPFNFGGPQPETPYPLSPEGEESFDYVGAGSWESTRNLRLSARDGFLPWLIVGSVAPRYLIYAHEFSWDQEHDPVWKRFQRIYAFYEAGDHLAAAHGAGVLSGRPPEATHCNNVGQAVYPSLTRWFGWHLHEEDDPPRYSTEELSCLTEQVRARWQPLLIHQLAAQLATERLQAARATREQLTATQKRDVLRRGWDTLLGGVIPVRDLSVQRHERACGESWCVERLLLEALRDMRLPTLLFLPTDRSKQDTACVVCIAQQGKRRFLVEHYDTVMQLVHEGIAVCLPDLRGMGETEPDGSRGRQSSITSISASELMLGQTLLGLRLGDLLSLFRYLKSRSDINGRRLAVWGDSFAEVNPLDLVDPPADSTSSPHQCEPVGPMLALLGALFDEEVAAVIVRRGLVSLVSVLSAPFCYVPHDILVPGALTVADLSDIAATLAPRPLRVEGCVDGRNCPVSKQETEHWWENVLECYARYPAHHLGLAPQLRGDVAEWLIRVLC